MQEKKQKFKKVLGNIIKEKRLEAKKSITLISNEIGLSKSVWLEIENANRDPQITTLWRICEGLNLSVKDIITELENKLGNLYFTD